MTATMTDIPDPVAAPAAYQTTLMALVGDRDPLTVLAATPRRLREVLASHTTDELERSPDGGEWSVADIVGHLLDGELVLAFRWRQVLTLDQPALPGYDEKRWAALPKPPLAKRFAMWETLRQSNLWLLAAISRDDWQRVGRHVERGPESIAVMVRMLAGHDLAHLDQLARVLAR